MAQIQHGLDALLTRYTELGLLPGIVAGLGNSEGTLYQGAAGKRNLDSGEQMTTDTIVAIASMTKPVTTVAALQLVDQGLLDLDAQITDYLPELHALKVLAGFDEEGNRVLRDPASIPTTRQLLSHTSGYVYEIWNENALRSVSNGQVSSLFDPEGDSLQAPLGFSPGERWEYGIGIDWAGVIIETLTGKALDVYFQDHIFSPLKMADTFYAVPETKTRRVASTYLRTTSGFELSPPLAVTISGGGGLYSTIADYLKFMRALLNLGRLDGANILRPQSVDMMFENQIGELTVGPGHTAIPEASNDFDMGFGKMAKWGLGFLLHGEQTEAGRPAGTGSWGGLFNSYFWIDRQNDICALIATQVMPFYDAHAVALLQEYEQSIYQNMRAGKAAR